MRYVLEGSVRKAGNRVRITGQLIDRPKRAPISGPNATTASSADVFELQDRVTLDVVGAITPKLERAEIERASQANRKPLPTTATCGVRR